MNQWTVTTEDRRLDQIVQLAAAHVMDGCAYYEANHRAIAQHAHLCELLAKEQPQAKTLGKVWEYERKLYTSSGDERAPKRGEVFLYQNTPIHAHFDFLHETQPILRELTPEEAAQHRKEQQ